MELTLHAPVSPSHAQASPGAHAPLRQPAHAPERQVEAPIEVLWARHDDELRAAQRLRYRVFAEEMGAQLSPPAGTPPGHDADAFDAHCEHLLVRTVGQGDSAPEVVGTYRVLTPAAAQRAGGLYSESEFDLTPLDHLRSDMVELGRSCVHPDWRAGGVIIALWAALAAFMQRNGLGTMVGCASVAMRDGGHAAASLWEQLRRSHLAPPALQVAARLPLPVDQLALGGQAAEMPPLIKGYLRCGAQVLGAPAWDPDFNTADLPMMMRLADLPPRYRRHFLG